MSRNIEIKDLMKIYTKGDNEIHALDHIDLTVQAGEFVALMGPSGSGKTTLLNIIAGVDFPTSGKVFVDEKDITALTESQKTKWRTRHIGYIFQFYNLMPVLTAYENVELPLLLLHMSKKERHEHVTAALEAVGISERSKHFPRELSGGQEQRVAIARAIVTDAHVVVADEPTGNLDAESEQEIMALMKQLNKQLEKTILMVTHDDAAAEFADRVVRLKKGKLV
jgi:putative ABC transport system ATP-binding protein